MPPRRFDPSQGPLILFINSFFGSVPSTSYPCGVPCRFTADRSRLAEADAVVFHLPNLREVREVAKHPGQLWVGWSMESTGHTPGLTDPRIRPHFDILMTFARSADVWCSYLPRPEEWSAALAKPPPAKTEARPAVMLQSAMQNLSGRNAFAAELMRHLEIDSYGHFLNNRAIPQPDRGFATKLQLIGPYRFCLGFENTIEPDYVTEKFFHPLLAGTLPVYRGAPNVEEFAPGDHCYIDASRFASPEALARHLLALARDEAAYAAYFDWRGKPLRPGFRAMLEAGATETFCRLASLVTERLAGRA